MRSLKIVAAHLPVAVTDRTNLDFGGAVSTNSAALLTPDPREVATLTATDSSFVLDLGEVKVFDTFFFGDNTFPGNAYVVYIYVSSDAGFATGAYLYNSGFAGDNSLSVTPVAANPKKRHGVIQGNVVVGRYISVILKNCTGTLGVMAAGLSFTARWGHEMGSGRPLLDRSTVEPLQLGGFGIDPGAITGGYQWSFGDLQQSEITALYQIIKSVGQSRSVLVIEDPDFDYGTPAIVGSAAFSGTAKNVLKTGGGNGYNAGAVFGLRDGVSTGISFKATYTTGGRLVGFWPLANAGGVYNYAIETAGATINRYTPAGAASIGSYAAGDRLSVRYDEGRQLFITVQNGTIIDAQPAAPSLGLYPGALLFSASGPADKIEELNVFGLGYEDRIHWGLLQKLDTFERADPANWRWSLAIGDWV